MVSGMDAEIERVINKVHANTDSKKLSHATAYLIRNAKKKKNQS